MTIKVIPTLPKRAGCPRCDVMLEFAPKDTKGSVAGGKVRVYVPCLVCGYQITIRTVPAT